MELYYCNMSREYHRYASFIRISLPFETDEQGTTAAGERFISDFMPAMREFLPK